MLSMKQVNGNLISMAKQCEFDVILHGTNCYNNMEVSKLGREIAMNFPEAKDADMATIKGDKSKLGSYSMVEVEGEGDKPLMIIILYTQLTHGGSRTSLDYDALETAMDKVKFLAGKKNLRIGYPMIGCDEAGGDWSIVSKNHR